MTDAPHLQFSAYQGGGRLLLDPPSGTGARKGYARDILRWCGYRCVYCDLGMRTLGHPTATARGGAQPL